jgi:hypothetical protein
MGLHLPPHVAAVSHGNHTERGEGEMERATRVVVHFLDLKKLLRLDAFRGVLRSARR